MATRDLHAKASSSSDKPIPPTQFINELHQSDIYNPSTTAILKTVDEISAIREKEANYYRPFVNLRDGRCCKRVRSTLEADFMLYLRKVTTIPVPEILMVFKHEKQTYIVMEFIESPTLLHSFHSMTGETISSVAKQLAGFVEQLRNLTVNDPQYLGSWPSGAYNSGLFDPMPFSSDTTPPPSEPFTSLEGFHKYWLKRFHSRGGILTTDILSTTTEDDRPTLSHGDLHPNNIFVHDGKIVSIVDWEFFGYYPSFWEAFCIHKGAFWNTRWVKAVSHEFGAMTELQKAYMEIIHVVHGDV